MIQGIQKIAGEGVNFNNLKIGDQEQIVKLILSFMDNTNTATDRATAYETQEQIRNSTIFLHNKVLNDTNRGIYSGILMLDGITDFTKQVGLVTLLSKEDGRDCSILELDTETRMVLYLTNSLKANRMLNLFEDLKEKRVNNTRTRKVILLSILNSPNIEYWAVKYRTKMADALRHAWGQRTTSIIQNIVSKKAFTTKERGIIEANIEKYIVNAPFSISYILECLNFIFGNKILYTLPILKSFIDSKQDLTFGSKLPREVLEGIRSTYHKKVNSAEVLKLTSQNLTDKEKMKVQSNAEKHGVKVDFDPSAQDLVDLYIHAYSNGNLTPDIKNAINLKSKEAATKNAFGYNKIGIVFDASNSSAGDITQHLRPLAIQMSTRDVLIQGATKSIIEYVGGDEKSGLVFPAGSTNIATALIKVLKQGPDVVFILSDGFENSPAGRTHEVINQIRKMGMTTPIFQINSVSSAIGGGVKKLSEHISTIPINKPNALASAMIKALLEQDFEKGIINLLRSVLPKLKRA